MSLGKVSVAIEAQMASFESDMGRAARIAEKEFKKVERDAKRMESEMKRVGKAMGLAIVAGVTAAATATVLFARDITKTAEEIKRFAALSGATTDTFQRWAAGAATVGISQEKLADQMKDFNEKAGEFQQTGGGGMKDFFDNIAPKVGLTAEAFRGLSGPQGLQLYFNALQKAGLNQQQMSFYMEAMASDTTALIPLLRDNGKAMGEFGDQAAKAGAVMGSGTLQAAADLKKEMIALDQVAAAFRNQLAAELLPQLKEGAARFRTLAENGDLARNAVSLLGAGLSAGVGILEGYTNAVNRTSIAIGTMVSMRAGMMEALQNAATFGMADGSLMGGLKAARAGMAEGQAELDALIARQNKAGTPRVLMSGRDAMPESMFRNPADAGAAAYTKPEKGAKGGRKSGTSALETAAREAQKARDELERLVEQTERAGAEFDALAASLAGPLAEAAYRFSVEQERLNELARTGEVDAGRLRAAQEQLRAEYEKNVEAINAQLSPAQEVHAAIQEEIKLLGMSAQAQEIYNNLKAAGVEANSAFGESIIASTQELQAMREQEAFMADVQLGLADAFVEMASGAKSAKDAFGDFADYLFKRALQMLADKAVQAMFDAFSGEGKQGGAAGGSGQGSDWGGLIASFFGGGRANGGPVTGSRFYEVGENNRPELLSMKGKQYLIPGNEGNVTPIRQGRPAGGGGVSQTFIVEGKMDRRTGDQLARKSGIEARRAMARNG